MSKQTKPSGKGTPIKKDREEENDGGRIGSAPNLYQLGAEIGRGGFGVVFQAFNLRTGDFVAVKRFPLNSIDKESLSSIEGEIELMQKLNHPNIVKYIDTIRARAHLYIVLEYMENGSLSNVIKKFGFFSESLTAIYITQVLKGLRYLHEQGVLHRDIKGANILTTKDGMVKLADFGVAIKLTEAHSDEQDVVGSPYWIAPEIIEMSAPTAACDIWSVGCIIIELLTGKPPYFELEPMAALFRIVSDDYPPFPEGISQALRDFLLNCFQKEPVMRSSAAKLLDHPWLTNSSTHSRLEEQTKRIANSKSGSSSDLHSSGAATDSVMNTIRLHQREAVTGLTSPSPSADLSQGSVEGIAMRPRSSPSESKSISASASASASMDVKDARIKHTTPMRPAIGLATTSPRLHQSSHLHSVSGTSAASTGRSLTPGVLLTHPETDMSDFLESAGSSVAPEMGAEALSRRGLVSHELMDSPRVDPTRSMSPISDSTAATKDNGRADAFPVSTLPPLDSDSDVPAGFSDDESPTNARHTGSFFNAKMGDDSGDEHWDDTLVEKTPSPDDLAHNVWFSEPNTSAKASPFIGRKSSHSSSTSEQNELQRNRSVDLAAKLKIASLNTSRPMALPAEGRGKERGFFSPGAANSRALSKYQECDGDSNFDDLFEASLGNTEAKRRPSGTSATKKKASSVMRTLARASTFESSGTSLDWKFSGSATVSPLVLDRAALPMAPSQRTKVGGVSPSVQRSHALRESADDLRSLSSSDDFDDLGFDDGDDEADEFADKLRSKLQQTLGKQTVTVDEEPDEFINYQFDEKDFKQNEMKDVHFRRSREVVDHLAKIRVTSPEAEIVSATEHIINLFSEFPEQRGHLITYHGVMPIIDMFESQCYMPDLDPATGETASSTYTKHVLVIVNTIIEGNVRAQEQLALMGIIPTIMNVLEKSCRRPAVPVAPRTASSMQIIRSASVSSYASARTPKGLRAEHTSSDPYLAAPSEDETGLSNNSGSSTSVVDPVTLEAAYFIHQISLSSSLTLQMLIGAGGLVVLTSMVSFGGRIGIVALSTPAHACEADDSSHNLSPIVQSPVVETPDSISAKILQADDRQQALASLKAGLPAGLQGLKVDIPTAPMSLEDAQKCMAVFQMGMDCVAQLFSVQSSRTRDFCRLFVKLGLLTHLSSAFANLKKMYYDVMRATTPDHAATSMLASSTRSTHRHWRSDSMASGVSLSDPFIALDGGAAAASSHSLNVQYNVEADDSAERIYASMIATLFFQFSRSDSVVAETMANPEKGVIRVILQALRLPELCGGAAASPSSASVVTPPAGMLGSLRLAEGAVGSSSALPTPFSSLRKVARVPSTLSPAYLEMLELLLKCLKNLSMEPRALADLERAGTIEAILPLLAGPLRDRFIVHILPCLFNLCRINKRRQELAASLGVVPHLKKVISEGSHLRQFALPIIFDLAHTSNATRMELWKHDCVSFYVNLLRENNWQSFALNSLAVWISGDAKNVGRLLVQPVCLTKLIDFFDKASSQTLHSLHKPLLDIMAKSSDLSSALSYSGVFISALVRRLRAPQEAIVLRTLLKMLQLLHQYHATPRQLVLDHGLYAIVKEFAQSESQVLVCQIANRLLMDFQLSTFS